MFEATKEVSSFLFVAVAHVRGQGFLAKFEIVRRHFSIFYRASVNIFMLTTQTFFYNWQNT